MSVTSDGRSTDELLMQIYSDVMRRPLSVADSDQGPALGAAIHAAVAAGAYADVPAAAQAMGKVRREVYTPVAENSAVYDELYAEYVLLHDYFGRGGNDVLHRLRALRDRIIEANPGDDADVDTTSGALDNEAGDS